jgi:cytochrome c biogenesis protein CcdA
MELLQVEPELRARAEEMGEAQCRIGIDVEEAAQLLKENLVYVVIAMGAGIIGLVVLMLLGRPVTLPIHGPQRRFPNRSADAFLFGTAYGLGALGCLFPLFILLFYMLALVARDRLQRSLRGVLPYVNRFAGVVVILAGIYIIWYQSALL